MAIMTFLEANGFKAGEVNSKKQTLAAAPTAHAERNGMEKDIKLYVYIVHI
jgi:hypothetical protein